MKKKISILSGGLDSTILTYKLVKEFGKENVIALIFQYGQRHSIELEKAKITCEKLEIPHRIIDINFLGDIVAPVCALSAKKEVEMPTIHDVIGDPAPVTEVPYRNQIFISIGFAAAQSWSADEVFLGIQCHDEYQYHDTSEYFVNNINALSALNRKHDIKLVTPFLHMSKKEEIEIGVKLKVPFGDTWTCYRGEEGNGACGTCPSCSERIQNFAKAGLIDPCKYEKKINWDKEISRWK